MMQVDSEGFVAAVKELYTQNPCRVSSLAFWKVAQMCRQSDTYQVLPENRGRGLGRLLVSETIRRSISKSDIIRVTGMADDFYRKCGFVGTESWCIITKS